MGMDVTLDYVVGVSYSLCVSTYYYLELINCTKSYVQHCNEGNNELEWYTPSNAHLSHGSLILEASKFITGNATGYTSAKIVSRGKADFGVANYEELKLSNNTSTTLEVGRRFESRMKLPWGRGIWPAFWMLPTDSTYGGWPKVCNVEFLYKSLHFVSCDN